MGNYHSSVGNSYNTKVRKEVTELLKGNTTLIISSVHQNLSAFGVILISQQQPDNHNNQLLITFVYKL